MGTFALTFGDKLKAHLEQRGMGVRTLASGLANGDTAKREGIRRRLNKYIHEGVTPSPPARQEIEAQLGLKKDELKGDLDDEEADPEMRQAFDMFVALMGRIHDRKATSQEASPA